MDTPLEVLLVLPGVLVPIQLTVNACGIIPQSAMSEPKELDFILLSPLRLWYRTRWNLNASVCVILDEGLCSDEGSDDI